MKNCCAVLVKQTEGPGKTEWLEIKWYMLDFVYDDDVNILGGKVRKIKNNAGALVVDIKETGLEVSAYKTKCIVIS
jgi:hypothetical protein